MTRPVHSLLLLLVSWLAASPQRAHPQNSDKGPVETILFGSCIKQDQPIPILNTILAHKPDVFVFLGDNIYADTEDMKVMSEKYAQLGAEPLFRRLRIVSRILAIWDDHDYGVNDGGASYPKRAESEKLFLDFWDEPVASPRRGRAGIYSTALFGPEGRRLQIILLDTRYFRSPLKKGAKRVGGAWIPDSDPEKTMLGEEQWEWLEVQLKKPAEIRIIASGIQCIAQDAGQETWSNLPHERLRLLKLIETTGAHGCLLISGDRHWSELSMTDENAPYPIYDLTSSALNQKHPRGTPTENRFRISPTTYHEENFGAIRIDWASDEPTIALEIRDIQDRTRIRQTLKLSDLDPIADR